jgi:hypothetical protein
MVLVNCDRTNGDYVIALRNTSTGAELRADFSYLEDVPRGTLRLEFTQMAAPLTQEMRPEFTPGSMGYQPTRNLVEVVAELAAYTEATALFSHRVVATVPDKRSAVGKFLHGIGLPNILDELRIEREGGIPASPEPKQYRDDDRHNIVPFTSLVIGADGRLTPQSLKKFNGLHGRIENAFAGALSDYPGLALQFATAVMEAVDNMVEYGDGGIIAGLYYPHVGEVELTLVNRHGGFGGSTPDEHMQALLAACEGATRRTRGGGNGIRELMRLTIHFFGTLVLRSGSATVYATPDGELLGRVSHAGFPANAASVTTLLQLLPSDHGRHAGDRAVREAFAATLAARVASYREGMAGSAGVAL